jgi:hypothetical protein
MKRRLALIALVAVVAASATVDLFACGDKFLVLSRGTRYQRPKNARAASILIYADPSSGLPAALKHVRADAVLKQEGHRTTTVETPEQLSAVLAGGRFDVVLAAASTAPNVERLLGGDPARAVVVTLDGKTKPGALLSAIDRAVEQRDKTARKRT